MRNLLVAIPLIFLASCVGPPAAPPAPQPVVVAPPPPPAPVAVSSDWRDWPLTPGDWTYGPDARGSTARFGRSGAAAELTLHCDHATRQITLARRQDGGGQPALTIRTTSTERALVVQPAGEGQVATRLAGTDPLFDAMGFSRGRFVVQQAGGTTLVLPAWAEILRVTEDCRG